MCRINRRFKKFLNKVLNFPFLEITIQSIQDYPNDIFSLTIIQAHMESTSFILSYHYGFISTFNLVLLCSILLCLLVYVIRFRHNHTELIYLNTEINEKLLTNCMTLRKYSRIPMWALNGHIQTIYASQIRKGPTYPIRREVLSSDHGSSFAIDWLPCNEDDNNERILCVFPGIAGHIDNDYIKNFIHYCKLEGFRVVVWNWPGCGDYNYLSKPYMPTLGDSKDIATMIDHVHKKFPTSKIYAVSFSLGANLVLKYLGEKGENTPITSAVSIAAGYCGLSGLKIIKQNRFYSKECAKKWKKVISQNPVLKNVDNVDLTKLEKVSMLHELDEEITVHMCGHKGLEEYYESRGCISHMKNIKRPTLLLNALDDPIVWKELVDKAKNEVNRNENLILGVTKQGGHMGWIQGGYFKPEEKLWLDQVAIEFIKSCMENLE